MVGCVPIGAEVGGEESEAFRSIDKTGQQFMNVRRMSIKLIKLYSHLETPKDSQQATSSLMFLKKDLDVVFETLLVAGKYVHLKNWS